MKRRLRSDGRAILASLAFSFFLTCRFTPIWLVFRSVASWLAKKQPDAVRVEGENVHLARHSGLVNVDWRRIDSDAERLEALVEEVGGSNARSLVFVNTVDAADNVVEALESRGVNSVPYHAKLPQSLRFENLRSFRRGGVDVMVATDLASRGLDIEGVEKVVQMQVGGSEAQSVEL